MDNFKKELFLKEYGTKIAYESLSSEENSLLNAFLEQKYNVEQSISKELFKVLAAKLPYNKEYSGTSSRSEFNIILHDLGLEQESNVFVIWHYPNEIDKFELSYLEKFWEDIWFDISDDAVALFFPIAKKIIVITHNSIVYY